MIQDFDSSSRYDVCIARHAGQSRGGGLEGIAHSDLSIHSDKQEYHIGDVLTEGGAIIETQ